MAILLFLIAGCGAPSATAPPVTHDLTVVIVIDETAGIGFDPWDSTSIGGPCSPQGTFASDIQAGTSVVISDQAGAILAKGAMRQGSKSAPGVCEFALKVTVPDATFYRIKVAQRPEEVASRDELVGSSWIASYFLKL